MTPAQQAIYANVIAPVFMNKCASRGRQFTPESLETHLENAAMIQMHKEANERDISKQANAALRGSLGMESVDHQDAGQQIKTAAANILANPELKKLFQTK